MSKLLDSFWRAALYCLHARVILLSLLPLAIMVALALGAAYFFWEGAVDAVRFQLSHFELITSMTRWLEGIGWPQLTAVLPMVILLFLAIPVIVIVSLLFVAMFMTPAMVALVAQRRFPLLERKRGGSFFASLLWSLGSTLLAVIALILSVPLWLVPPLILILPPLIWGWLTYRVMSYDALADHASPEERRQIFSQHRATLLLIGVLSGYLGAAPSLLWASGAMFVAMAPILVPVAIWVYTLVFAFSSLWFAHYLLSALDQLRATNNALAPDPLAQEALASITQDLSPAAHGGPAPAFGTLGGPDHPYPHNPSNPPQGPAA
ncbi:MAG: EI24 domain-containing protein [Comamonadaceae bacterium]|nr:MAG: EI24 domain-containing protein [Comamonadaceae bacterium]